MKILVLLRHAHREKIPGKPDNGLSKKGWSQAADTANTILTRWNKEWKQGSLKIKTSPRLRCLETSDPVSKLLKIPAKVDPLLDEAHGEESGEQFISRIKQFLTNWKRSDAAITILCSHGDWIPEALRLLVDKEVDIRKGAFIEVTSDEKAQGYSISYSRDPATPKT